MCASLTAASTSSSLYVKTPGGAYSLSASPSKKIFTISHRFFASERTAFRIAQGPSAMIFLDSSPPKVPSALLPVDPRSRSDAASLGPHTLPSLIASRNGTSKPCAEPKLIAEVKPEPSSTRAFSTASNMARGKGWLFNC